MGDTDDELMGLALHVAGRAFETDDIPVGAIVVDGGGIVIGQGCNRREADQDPTAHAEVVALRAAASTLKSWRLDGCTLIVTLEPCAMCAGAIVGSRIQRLVFGAFDEKAGAVGSLWDIPRDRRLNHQPEVISGIRADESATLLRTYFLQKR